MKRCRFKVHSIPCAGREAKDGLVNGGCDEPCTFRYEVARLDGVRMGLDAAAEAVRKAADDIGDDARNACYAIRSLKPAEIVK